MRNTVFAIDGIELMLEKLGFEKMAEPDGDKWTLPMAIFNHHSLVKRIFFFDSIRCILRYHQEKFSSVWNERKKRKLFLSKRNKKSCNSLLYSSSGQGLLNDTFRTVAYELLIFSIKFANTSEKCRRQLFFPFLHPINCILLQSSSSIFGIVLQMECSLRS